MRIAQVPGKIRLGVTVVESRGGGVVFIVTTLFIGMVLAVMPIPHQLPEEMGYLRPDWVALVLVYWIIALPQRVGMISAWIVGVIVDVLTGSLLGQHALSYVVLAYVALNLYQRLRMFTVWQQSLILFAFMGLNQLINLWIENLAGLSSWNMWYLLPALSGALLWPWIFMLLRSVRRKSGIS